MFAKNPTQNNLFPSRLVKS
uniref:Uncharacterized protein n=1 Tax=Rhizophora mucronata TaxID=61149 RepID=A0A2P2NWQ1_RHIMU